VPKRPWIKDASIPWPRLHLHLYILRGNPIFGERHPKPRKSSSLAAAKRGRISPRSAPWPRKKKGQGASAHGNYDIVCSCLIQVYVIFYDNLVVLTYECTHMLGMHKVISVAC
jgi:hypothetical protein